MLLLVCVVCVRVVCAVRAGRVCVLQSRRELTVWAAAAARFRVLVPRSLQGGGLHRCPTLRWLGCHQQWKGACAYHHVVVAYRFPCVVSAERRCVAHNGLFVFSALAAFASRAPVLGSSVTSTQIQSFFRSWAAWMSRGGTHGAPPPPIIGSVVVTICQMHFPIALEVLRGPPYSCWVVLCE